MLLVFLKGKIPAKTTNIEAYQAGHIDLDLVPFILPALDNVCQSDREIGRRARHMGGSDSITTIFTVSLFLFFEERGE